MAPATAVKEAVIVAAGFGSRLQSIGGRRQLIKPLAEVGGVPILKRILDTTFACGIERVHLVVGFMAEELTKEVSSWELNGTVTSVFNSRFELSNGVSLFVGAQQCSGEFILLMSDHLFEKSNLTGLMKRGLRGDDAVLAVDRKIDDVFDLDDATKVRTAGDRIVAIGKGLNQFDCVDTGMFLMSSAVTASLELLIQAQGDASISDAMNGLIAQGRMGACDVGAGLWQDVDTPEMFGHAEAMVHKGVF